MLNVVVCSDNKVAEAYCKSNGLKIENTTIKMYFDYYGSFLNLKPNTKLKFHDLDNNLIFEINNIKKNAIKTVSNRVKITDLPIL